MEIIPVLKTDAEIQSFIKSGARFLISPAVTRVDLAEVSEKMPNREFVAEAIRKNSSITQATINVPIAADAADILTAFTRSLTLQELNVHCYGKDILMALNTLLKRNCVIKKLELWGFGDHSAIIDIISEGLASNSSLEQITFLLPDDQCETSVLRKDYDSILTALQANDTIEDYSVIALSSGRKLPTDPSAYSRKPCDFKVVIKRTGIERNLHDIESHIKNSNWEELAKVIKEVCHKKVVNNVYPQVLNLSAKAFVDKLAIHSLKHLLDDTCLESVKLDVAVQETTKQLDVLTRERKELQSRLAQIESNIAVAESKLESDSKALQDKKQAQETLCANLKKFQESFERTEPALKEWQQKLQTDISEWTNNDVLFLLTDVGLQKYASVFEANNIDGAVLQALDTSDLTVNLEVSFKDAKQLLMYRHLIETHHDIYTIPPGVLQWNNDTVCTWLEDNKFGHLVDVFKKNEITGADLAFLEKVDLIGQLQIKVLSDVIKLQKEILRLKESILDDRMLPNQNLANNNNNVANSQLEHQLEEMKRFNKELKIALKEKKTKIPEAFICPITQDIMNDPVFASDGHTYERTAIELWLKNNNTSPMTGLQLSNKQLTPSHTLKSMIREFIDANNKK